jgi:hypothetical protein
MTTMTDIEKLILQAAATQIDLLRKIAHASGIYLDAKASNLQEQIEATLDSMRADEIDALK